MDEDFRTAVWRHIELRTQAQALLGQRALSLLESYGKFMEGPRSGFYVSAASGEELLAIAKRLHDGQTLPIHLMHRHRSGDYEPSSLRWTDGRFVMVFADREQLA